VVRPDDPIADFGGVDVPTIRRWVARINSLSEPMPEPKGTPGGAVWVTKGKASHPGLVSDPARAIHWESV